MFAIGISWSGEPVGQADHLIIPHIVKPALSSCPIAVATSTYARCSLALFASSFLASSLSNILTLSFGRDGFYVQPSGSGPGGSISSVCIWCSIIRWQPCIQLHVPISGTDTVGRAA